MLFKLILSSLLATALADVLLPSVDPFYQAPAGSQNVAPGTVFKNRTITPGTLGFLSSSVNAIQLLYQTTALNGARIATVTTLFIPKNAKSGMFISYQAAEDSADVDCAPSYQLQSGSKNLNQGDPGSNSIQMYLSKGYIVAVPDYEGPDAAFPSRIEGFGVLDGMRAVNNWLGGSQSIVGAGYSGGAIATGWAASFQSSYASELNIKGWTLGGTPANITGTILFQTNTLFAGFALIAFDGFAKPSANGTAFNTTLTKYLTSKGSQALAFANTHCVGDVLTNFSGKSFLSTDYNTAGAGLLNVPAISAVLTNQTIGIDPKLKPVAPVLLYHGQMDEVVPYANASTLYNNWCAQGVPIHFTTYTIGGHILTAYNGFGQALSYADQFFSGTAPSGCSTETKVL